MVGRGGERNRPPRRTLGDYAYQQGPKHYNNIAIPPFSNKVVEFKPTLLSMFTPFCWNDHEDSYTHLSTFMKLCSTMAASDEDVEVVYLIAFPFSLIGKAKTWLQSHPNKSPNTWKKWRKNSLQGSFLRLDSSMQNQPSLLFFQGSDEPLCETWERFKSLLWRCPNHSFDDAAQLHIFYSGLKP